MGVASHGRCFGDVIEAAQAECTTYPRTAVDASGVTTWSCSGVAGDGASLSLVRTDGAGASVAATVSVSFPACDELESYTDASTLWGAGISALVVVYCLRAFVLRLIENQ